MKKHDDSLFQILSNEKYKGDAVINKTYITDCLSKKVRANNGERPKFYVENNHPAIIDAGTAFPMIDTIIILHSCEKCINYG